MFGEDLRENSNIVEVDQCAKHFKIPQEIVHGPLEFKRRVAKAMWHEFRLKYALNLYQITSLSISRREINLPISADQVHEQEVVSASQHAKSFVNTGEWLAILLSDQFEPLVVHYNAVSTIFLPGKEDVRSPRAFDRL